MFYKMNSGVKNITKGQNLLKSMLVGSLLVGVSANARYHDECKETKLASCRNVMYTINHKAVKTSLFMNCKRISNVDDGGSTWKWVSTGIPCGDYATSSETYDDSALQAQIDSLKNNMSTGLTNYNSEVSSNDSTIQDIKNRLDDLENKNADLESTVYSCTQ